MNAYLRLNLGITKVYLLPCSGGYLLIDTGYPSDYNTFRASLDRAGVPIKRIKYLLLTHYHDDHAGFANVLKKDYRITLIVQRQSIPLLAQGDSGKEEEGCYITRRMRLLFSLFELFHRHFTYPPVEIDSSDLIVDGDDRVILRRLGVDADILYTPGHSIDSMSVLRDDGSAFVGDAAMNFMKFAGTRYRPIYYSDLPETYRSIRKLIASGATTIMPAHGKPFPVSKLKAMLERFGEAESAR